MDPAPSPPRRTRVDVRSISPIPTLLLFLHRRFQLPVHNEADGGVSAPPRRTPLSSLPWTVRDRRNSRSKRCRSLRETRSLSLSLTHEESVASKRSTRRKILRARKEEGKESIDTSSVGSHLRYEGYASLLREILFFILPESERSVSKGFVLLERRKWQEGRERVLHSTYI